MIFDKGTFIKATGKRTSAPTFAITHQYVVMLGIQLLLLV